MIGYSLEKCVMQLYFLSYAQTFAMRLMDILEDHIEDKINALLQ